MISGKTSKETKKYGRRLDYALKNIIPGQWFDTNGYQLAPLHRLAFLRK